MTLLTSCSNNPLATSPHSRRSHTGNFPFTIFQFTDIQSTTTTLHSHLLLLTSWLLHTFSLAFFVTMSSWRLWRRQPWTVSTGHSCCRSCWLWWRDSSRRWSRGWWPWWWWWWDQDRARKGKWDGPGLAALQVSVSWPRLQSLLCHPTLVSLHTYNWDKICFRSQHPITYKSSQEPEMLEKYNTSKQFKCRQFNTKW